MPTSKLEESDFNDGKILILDLLLKTKLVPSKAEARRLIEQGGITLIKNDNNIKIDSIQFEMLKEDFINNSMVIKKGKKTYHKIDF